MTYEMVNLVRLLTGALRSMGWVDFHMLYSLQIFFQLIFILSWLLTPSLKNDVHMLRVIFLIIFLRPTQSFFLRVRRHLHHQSRTSSP